VRATHLAQFDEVEPAFAALTLADEGLWLPEPVRELALVKSCFLPQVAQQRREPLVIRRVNALAHPG
jgi:hypothetical protein